MGFNIEWNAWFAYLLESRGLWYGKLALLISLEEGTNSLLLLWVIKYYLISGQGSLNFQIFVNHRSSSSFISSILTNIYLLIMAWTKPLSSFALHSTNIFSFQFCYIDWSSQSWLIFPNLKLILARPDHVGHRRSFL